MQKLLGMMRRAVQDFDMISDGDKIAVGLSGGKDSLLLLALLKKYQSFAPEKFELAAVHADMGFPETSTAEQDALAAYVEGLGVPYTVVKTDIAQIIFEERKEKNPCSLCSKMRRGAVNEEIKKMGFGKLAYGHHADDVLETMLLSLLFEGRFSTFQPTSFLDRTEITLIRPMVYIEECDIRSVVKELSLPVVYNPCPADKHTQREYTKTLVKTLIKDIPGAKERMLGAIFHPERNNLWPPKNQS